MSILLAVILPVFLVIGAGGLAARRGAISAAGVDGLMRFSQGIAIPCLLFKAMATLNLGQDFDVRLVATYYTGSLACFLIGTLAARRLFGRDWEDSVAIGFVALFSNSLLLGLPITERAFGSGSTSANFAIIAFHSPFCYAVGITAMEIARAHGHPPHSIPAKILRAIFSNALIVGILLGLIVNLAGLPIPTVADEALDMLIRAALPTALFGLGGVISRYRIEGDLPTILFTLALSLLLHPAIAWSLGSAFALPQDAFRSVVVTAAMAPGANAYLFAAMYGRAMRVAASCVLLGTALSILTAAGWLALLP
ncbi:malonate transporter [Rubellimicrobium mesophilum DSM 19309]|uniref:Malonate transporter n=1 Tax=Rubellimicrobium mesophilum DSM 19309 TaxID=442562 RepID=A0A017HTB7_9RHOB|nr:AEC family transporter [Rubellimicrobium mesophilum]EYD77757.1 malonate transporter [Rubellimicrobium mesophilum DSM 19309]